MPPILLGSAVRHAAPYGYSELNLNCGCPSVEAGGADFGAALMRRPDATRRMLEEMAAAAGGVPVSLKCRVGTHDRAAAAPPMDEYEPLADFVQAVSRSGAVRRSAVHSASHSTFHSASHSTFHNASTAQSTAHARRIHNASLLRCSTWRCTHAPQCSPASRPCTTGACHRCGLSWWRASRSTSRRLRPLRSGCNPMQRRLQPLCNKGCNPMQRRLRSYAMEAATPCKPRAPRPTAARDAQRRPRGSSRPARRGRHPGTRRAHVRPVRAAAAPPPLP